MVNWIWHTKPIDQILKHFNASMAGLSGPEVVELRQKYGPNSLPEAKPESLAMIFLRQFKSPLIYILVIAGILIYFTGENTDAIIIFFILVFNALVGTIQEGRAQRTLSSLKKLVETKAVVLRNNIEEIIPDIEVVPGDILVLREGDKIPADARLITVHSLAVDESSLTGESQPVYKSESLSKIANLPTAEQKNMVFKGTNVVAGAGTAVVVATGVETVIGKISEKIATIESEDPIRRDIRKLSRTIIVVAALTCVTLFTAGLVSGKTLSEMFATVVSLAVSIIPEGLPIVLTLVLATGVWRMSKKNALVKKLQAVESLGQAKIIAVDKTGTITRNELTIAEIYVDGKTYTVSGSGYEPSGQILLLGQALSDPPAGVTLLAKSAALCSSAQVAFSEEKQLWQVSGDPTEAALVVFGQKLGYRKEALEEDMPQIEEMPFSSATKYHAVVHKNNSGQEILTVIGAPEAVLDSLTLKARSMHLVKLMG
jgi:Ca2+-transporting ATPase